MPRIFWIFDHVRLLSHLDGKERWILVSSPIKDQLSPNLNTLSTPFSLGHQNTVPAYISHYPNVVLQSLDHVRLLFQLNGK